MNQCISFQIKQLYELFGQNSYCLKALKILNSKSAPYTALYPIFNSLLPSMKKVHFGYQDSFTNLEIQHSQPYSSIRLYSPTRFFYILENYNCKFNLILCCVVATLYAWVVVFILPVNSAVNPLLYTFTTPKYCGLIKHIGLRKATGNLKHSRKHLSAGD